MKGNMDSITALTIIIAIIIYWYIFYYFIKWCYNWKTWWKISNIIFVILFIIWFLLSFSWDIWVWFFWVILLIISCIFFKATSVETIIVVKKDENWNIKKIKIDSENSIYIDWKKENWYKEEYLDKFRKK